MRYLWLAGGSQLMELTTGLVAIPVGFYCMVHCTCVYVHERIVTICAVC